MKITKSSGVQEPFKKSKFCQSLREAGADKTTIDQVCEKIARGMKPGMSTSQLFRRASRYLTKQNPEVAARYSLKKGIAALGPAGFIFEQFVETLLRELGYVTERNVMVSGACITHEVDVLAKHDTQHFLIEAKYHNKSGIKTPLDVVMYADARLADIEKKQKTQESEKNEHRMWIITNTKVSSSGIQYARCKNITVTGWDYPENEGLEDLITRYALYPVTILPSVGKFEREQFAKHNMMLARDLAPYSVEDLTQAFGIHKRKAQKITAEAHRLVLGGNEHK